MSNSGSKFGMLKSLNHAATESTKSEKQNDVLIEKQNTAKQEKQKDTGNHGTVQASKAVSKNTRAEKQNTAKAEQSNSALEAEPVDRYHYSSYMPSPLYARLQLYVAKKKAARGKTGEKVSLQSVITEALEQYLDQHDR